jgi:hypothetical protein
MNKINKYIVVISTAFALIFSSCEKEKTGIEIDEEYLSLYVLYDINYLIKIPFKAHNNWKAISSEDWITFSYLQNIHKHGKTTLEAYDNGLEINCEQNPFPIERKANITITCDKKDYVIDVIQEAYILNPIPISSITLNTHDITLAVGGKFTLTASFSPENATYTRVIWISTNEKIVKINRNTGEMTAIKEGKASINVIVPHNTKVTTCQVTVTKK